MTESKTFDTSTLKGLRQAERYQQKLYGKYDKVEVKPLGLTRTTITGRT
jgi:hypothetical protein